MAAWLYLVTASVVARLIDGMPYTAGLVLLGVAAYGGFWLLLRRGPGDGR
ncbi:hypothetical protein [Micromonospora globispora]|nr:hypothetical protein [Micromonospora globispora]